MHSSAVLAVLASAALASADMVHPGHLAVKREVVARQTETTLPSMSGVPDTACLTALVSIYSSIPTPPPELLSYEAAHPPTDPCSYSVDDSIKPAFSSYESQVVSWASVHEKELSSALAKCPDYSTLASEANICTTGLGSGSGSSGSQTTGSGSQSTGSSSGGSSSAAAGTSGTSAGAAGSSSTSKALAPQQTGFVAAVIAAAGFVGAVAAL